MFVELHYVPRSDILCHFPFPTTFPLRNYLKAIYASLNAFPQNDKVVLFLYRIASCIKFFMRNKIMHRATVKVVILKCLTLFSRVKKKRKEDLKYLQESFNVVHFVTFFFI